LVRLYRWVCALPEFPAVQVPGKSRLHDYAHWLSASQMELVLSSLNKALVNEERALQIGLENELDTAGVFERRRGQRRRGQTLW